MDLPLDLTLEQLERARRNCYKRYKRKKLAMIESRTANIFERQAMLSKVRAEERQLDEIDRRIRMEERMNQRKNYAEWRVRAAKIKEIYRTSTFTGLKKDT